jgi:CBS domain containing-hemolysin-like protein
MKKGVPDIRNAFFVFISIADFVLWLHCLAFFSINVLQVILIPKKPQRLAREQI